MFISTVELSNVNSFLTAKINLSGNINILIGNNNSGKSSLIKAMYAAQNPAFFGNNVRVNATQAEVLIHFMEIEGREMSLFSNTAGQMKIRSDVFLYNKFFETSGYMLMLVDARSPAHIVDLQWIAASLTNHQQKDTFNGLPNTEDRGNFIFPYFAKRKLPSYTHEGGKEIALKVLENFQNIAAKIQKVSSHPSTKNEFTKYCLDILGFEVVAIPGEKRDYNIGIYTGSTHTIPIESMGEGVINIVGLITMLLSPDRKLYLIEELENDIHPGALKKLLELIITKSRKNQFVISTHSNIVLKYLASLNETRIFHTTCLQYDPNGNNIPTSTIHEIENTTGARLKLLEDMGYDLFDYEIYEAYLILEESSAEKIIRDFLIPKFFPGLVGRVRTIAAQGAEDIEPKFNDLHRLTLYLHTSETYRNRSWVIADGDPAGVKAVAKLKEKFVNWDHTHFINLTREDFEQYYPPSFQEKVKEILENTHDRHARMEAKRALFLEVWEWIQKSTDNEAELFAESAKELIGYLRGIEHSLGVRPRP
jgi:predicted ATPase